MNLSFHSKKHTKAKPTHSIFHKICRDIYVDWMIIIMVMCLASAALMVVGYQVYKNASADMAATPARSITHKITFDDKLLGFVLTAYDARAYESAALKVGYSGVADPSK